MGRRKNYMDDGQDSSDEEGGRISFNVTEDDLESEMAGFSGSRQQRRHRGFEDDSSDEEDARGGLGAGSTSSLAASFLPTSFQAASDDASPKPKKDPVKQKVKSSMSFNRSGSSTPPPSSGFGEFNKHSKGFGKKMLEKMGWSAGKGLGAEGTGIVNPIETKLRPARMGLSFKGFDERTDQAKAEEKFRHGSDSEQEEEEEQKPKRRNAWKENGSKKQQTKKRKTIYKTAAQIIEETQYIPVSDSKVIDMTGPSIREIDISEIRRTDSPTLMETSSRFPELRHNLQLLMDLAKGDLENLARETQSSTLKMSTMQAELEHDQKSLNDQDEELKKVEKLQEITQQLERISRDALGTGAYNSGNITALFGECFDVLEREFVNEIGRFEIDHIVIAVWAPVLKYNSVNWNVLENPTFGLLDVKRWRKLLRSNDDEKAANGWTSRAQQTDLVCTPFETMLNTIWLSKVRSAINNQWDIQQPDPIIQLLEEWEPVLPEFILDNIIDQLVLPKINRAVSDWNPRTDPVMIHKWILPWLSTMKAYRLGDLFTTIRHKISVVLRQWHPSDESALHIISPWKDVWTPEQMENFVIKSILPKLTMVLREEFSVNPRDQKMEPLIWCLAWKDVISDTIMGQLLENEFFNDKWLHVLKQWLSLDVTQINYDEISDWYRWWRQVFNSYHLDSNKLVMQCFRKGLEMMDHAIGGDDLYSMGLSRK